MAIRPENILQSLDVDGGKPWQQAVCHETASQQKIYCSLGIDAVYNLLTLSHGYILFSRRRTPVEQIAARYRGIHVRL